MFISGLNKPQHLTLHTFKPPEARLFIFQSALCAQIEPIDCAAPDAESVLDVFEYDPAVEKLWNEARQFRVREAGAALRGCCCCCC